MISNLYLIRQSFQGFRCKSGIAIFAWRVTWNYAYSLLKMVFLMTADILTDLNHSPLGCKIGNGNPLCKVLGLKKKAEDATD